MQYLTESGLALWTRGFPPCLQDNVAFDAGLSSHLTNFNVNGKSTKSERKITRRKKDNDYSLYFNNVLETRGIPRGSKKMPMAIWVAMTGVPRR